MATYHPRRMFVENFLSVAVLSCLVICSHELRQLREDMVTTQSPKFQTVQVSSLFPSSSCQESSSSPQQGDDGGRSFLKVAHKDGPCAQPGRDKASAGQAPLQDQSRVEAIQSSFSKSKNAATDGLKAWTPAMKDGVVEAGN